MNKIILRSFVFLLVFITLSVTVEANNPREKMWLPEINAFLKQDSISFPEKNQILFVGSSSIRMWQNLQSYFEGYSLLQRGVGGTQLQDIILFSDKIVFPYSPAQIVLYEGDNDIKYGFTPMEYLEDVKTFVRLVQIKQPNTPILILSVKPSPARDVLKEKYLEVNELLKCYCKDHKMLTYVDITPSVLNPDGEYRISNFLSDKLHLSDNAYKQWAEIIKPHLLKK